MYANSHLLRGHNWACRYSRAYYHGAMSRRVKSLQSIGERTIVDLIYGGSNPFQWLDLEIGHQDINPSDVHQLRLHESSLEVVLVEIFLLGVWYVQYTNLLPSIEPRLQGFHADQGARHLYKNIETLITFTRMPSESGSCLFAMSLVNWCCSYTGQIFYSVGHQSRSWSYIPPL